jgi:hypothetical protein
VCGTLQEILFDEIEWFLQSIWNERQAIWLC